MRDEDELRVLRHAASILCVARDVDIVERRLDLVEEAERRGSDLEDGEQQRDCRKSLFAAREQVDILNILARGLNLYLNGTFKHIERILKNKLRLAAAEQLRERLTEDSIYAVELLPEPLRHFAGQVAYEREQLRAGAFDIVYLSFHELVALGDLFVFLNSADIDIAEGSYLVLYIIEIALRFLRIFDNYSEFLRLAASELIFVIELVLRIFELALH